MHAGPYVFQVATQNVLTTKRILQLILSQVNNKFIDMINNQLNPMICAALGHAQNAF